PPPQLGSLRHMFSVVQIGTELRLGMAPPDLLLLSDEGLQELYTSRPIYFWDQADSPTLVPDQRYLPKSVTSARRPGEIVRWLTAGPSSWLAPVLQPLPEVEFKETSFDQGRLVVNLSSKARSLDKVALRRLADQLRWSTGQSNGLELSIEG